MQVFKQVSYVQILKGWQTYVFPVSGGFLRYKLLTTSQELEEAKERCHLEGWKIIDATQLVKRLNKISR